MSAIIRFGLDLAKNSFAFCKNSFAFCDHRDGGGFRRSPLGPRAHWPRPRRPHHRSTPRRPLSAPGSGGEERRQRVAEHTRLDNRLRGFLAEFGIVVPKGTQTFKTRWRVIRQRHDTDLPALAWTTLDALTGKLTELHQQVLAYDRQINAFVRRRTSR